MFHAKLVRNESAFVAKLPIVVAEMTWFLLLAATEMIF